MKKLILTGVLLLATVVASFGQQPQKGYRGFVDWDNNFAAYYWEEDVKTAVWFTGLSTSHGYQFNPNLFIGAGAMLQRSTKYSMWLVPVFAHVRTDQQWGNYTPFGDLRIGYNTCSGGGIYFAPSIGYRISTGGIVAMNISIGLTLRGSKIDIYKVESTQDPELGLVVSKEPIGKRNECKAMFDFRIGIDF